MYSYTCTLENILIGIKKSRQTSHTCCNLINLTYANLKEAEN